MLSFGSADELVPHLKLETAKGGRFATRFILVQGSRSWDDLIPKLSFEVDRVLRLSELCSGPDVLPDSGRLVSCLRDETRGCRSILLLPLSECVRLDPDTGDVIAELAQWPTGDLRRIYVPLLGAEDLFSAAMRRVVRYRAGELPEPWFLAGDGSCETIVAPFAPGSPGRQVVQGIRQYLRLWEQRSVPGAWVVTAMAPWLPVQQSGGECRVRVYRSTFEYVQGNANWDAFREDWGSAEQWGWLATQLQDGDSLEEAARRLLNIADYDAAQLFALWGEFDRHRRWLAWLWSKMRSKAGSYLHHVVKDSDSVDDLSHRAAVTIFTLARSVSLSRERRELLERLGVTHMPPEFWAAYGQITDPLDRLAVLTSLSTDEQEQAIRCVRELAAGHASETWDEYLEVAFPEVAWYLWSFVTGDGWADRYFSAYRRCRVKDQVDEELAAHITDWAQGQLLWSYPTRSDLLARLRANGAKVVWVDAMGAEWIGLLTRMLARDAPIDCQVSVARGCLPTTTEANQEWETTDDVERGLDDIAHHYGYRFPQSFLNAIKVIAEVAHKLLARLSQHQVVVVASDHGLSRFAATSDVRVDAPAEAEVVPPGRYAILGEGGPRNGQHQGPWVVDQRNAVLLTHARFAGGGACRGEVHGGATPEEYLTPVLVLRRKSDEIQLNFEMADPVVRLTPRGEGVLTVRSSRKVVDVELRVAGRVLRGESDTGLTWSFSMAGLGPGNYLGTLYSEGQSVREIAFRLVKGVIRDDLGM
ncbi:MAG: BREX-4 system phosphatase PglZ [Bacillota bacterium]